MKPTESKNLDRILLVAVLTLLILGTGVIFSASSFWSADRHNDYAMYLKRQLLRVLIGLAILFIASKVDYHRYREWTPLLVPLVFALLVAVFFAPTVNGVHRILPLFGQKFQPAEAMKLMLVFYLAAVLAKGPGADRAPIWDSPLAYHYLYLLVCTALVFFEPDMGTAMVVFFLGLALFFLGGIPKRVIAQMVAVVIPMLTLGMLVNPYQWLRLKSFVLSLTGSGPMSYQVEHSLIALSRGGILGVGFGEGHEKNLFLPQPFSDFILSSLGEELGFVGILVLFVLLFLVFWRGFRIASRAKDQYGFLLAGGITCMILINALINAGVVLNLLPTTGLPFPFISYGGSSLFMYMAGVGILLNVSRSPEPSFKDFTSERGRAGFRK